MSQWRKATRLTDKSYWDSTYEKRGALKPMCFSGISAHCARKILSLKEKIGLDKKAVLEIGGGGSAWLAFLARAYPTSEFTCLDYSEAGIDALRNYASENNIENIKFIIRDMFDAPRDGERFDFVFSHGVVEHFPDLPNVLQAHAKYLKRDGVMLAIIPNMAGSLGILTRLLNKDIYDIHVPHDKDSFLKGHEDAGLEVLGAGYLCPANFGVLASCVKKRPSLVWLIYGALTLISRFVWLVEERICPLPESRFFSPYIFVVSRCVSTKDS